VAPSTATPAEAPFVVPEEFNVPAAEAPQEQQQPQQPVMAPTEAGGFVVPEEFQQQQPAAAPMQKTRTEMSRDVLNNEVTRIQGSLATTTDPSKKAFLQRDLEAVQREILRLK
jgi:hypothetical protein